MDCNCQPGRHAIQFNLAANSDVALDELSFSVLVEAKFKGKIVSSRKFWNIVDGKRRLFICVDVVFQDYVAFDNASVHCRRNLTALGSIREDYLGALDYADPGRLRAKALKTEAMNGESLN